MGPYGPIHNKKGNIVMVPRKDGGFYRAEDVAALLGEIKQLREESAILREALGQIYIGGVDDCGMFLNPQEIAIAALERAREVE